jgi:hypothetical protein
MGVHMNILEKALLGLLYGVGFILMISFIIAFYAACIIGCLALFMGLVKHNKEGTLLILVWLERLVSNWRLLGGFIGFCALGFVFWLIVREVPRFCKCCGKRIRS